MSGLNVQWERWYYTVGFGLRTARKEMTRLDKKILREIKGCERNVEVSDGAGMSRNEAKCRTGRRRPSYSGQSLSVSSSLFMW